LSHATRGSDNKEDDSSDSEGIAVKEKRGLSERVSVALENSLLEVRKSNPDVLSVAVVDEVGALLAFSGEVFVSTKDEEFNLGTILMFIHGMAEAGSRFLGAGQVQSVHVNCDGGKWFAIRLGRGAEVKGLLGMKTTIEANLAAVMLDAQKAADKITGIMAETKGEREAFFEAPKRLSKLTAEDMAAWWGLRFKTLKEKKAKVGKHEEEPETTSWIKDYWDKALRKTKKKS
jgi:predicted regulator of Ras-like GTPase activity (Roadblock/LC7/MglB family)